jgi:hypothetical protein
MIEGDRMKTTCEKIKALRSKSRLGPRLVRKAPAASGLPPAPKADTQLLKAWGAEHALTPGNVKSMALSRVTLEEATRDLKLRRPAPAAGTRIPYFDTSGKLTGMFRVRFDKYPTRNPKPMRYSQPKDSQIEAYFPPLTDWKAIEKDSSIALLISEGEAKSAASTAAGYPCIGIGGVGCFSSSKRGLALLPELEKFNWKNRTVGIVFDSDAATNPNVVRAENRLRHVLQSRGATVYIVRLAPDGKNKVGLDDLLVKRGVAALQAALDSVMSAAAGASTGDREPLLVCLADVQEKTLEYLSKPRLPLGMISGLEGNPGQGKSLICVRIAADGSRGVDSFTGARCESFSTVYMSNENLLAAVTKPRFEAAGGDVQRFFSLECAVSSDGTKSGITLADIPLLEKAVVQAHAKLLVIDPLQSYMGANVDSHKANETRPLLDGLARLAEKLNICILIIRHLAKGGASRAIFAGLGSIDIAAAMRSVLMAGCAPDDENNRALVQTKAAAGMLAPSLRFAIGGVDVRAKITWRGQSELTGADLMAPQGGAKSEIHKAVEFLREQLKVGPKLQTELVTDDFSVQTLRRAADRIGVKKTRRGVPGKGAQGPWEWSLSPPLTRFTRGGGGGDE